MGKPSTLRDRPKRTASPRQGPGAVCGSPAYVAVLPWANVDQKLAAAARAGAAPPAAAAVSLPWRRPRALVRRWRRDGTSLVGPGGVMAPDNPKQPGALELVWVICSIGVTASLRSPAARYSNGMPNEMGEIRKYDEGAYTRPRTGTYTRTPGYNTNVRGGAPERITA